MVKMKIKGVNVTGSPRTRDTETGRVLSKGLLRRNWVFQRGIILAIIYPLVPIIQGG